MGRTGVALGNAVAEFFFASLKNEISYQYVYTERAWPGTNTSKCFTSTDGPIPAWPTAPQAEHEVIMKTSPQPYQPTLLNQKEYPNDLPKTLDPAHMVAGAFSEATSRSGTNRLQGKSPPRFPACHFPNHRTDCNMLNSLTTQVA